MFSKNKNLLIHDLHNFKNESNNILHIHKFDNSINIPELSNLKIIATLHHDLSEYDQFHNIKNWDLNLKKIKYLSCLSRSQKNLLDKIYNIKSFLIPHGYSNLSNEILIQNKINNLYFNKKINIGILSKRYPRLIKGEQYLYQLADHLDRDKFKFILYGKNRNFDFNIISSLGFEVDFYDYLPHHVYLKLLDSLHFQLILSGFEGGPASLSESLSRGVPVISFNIGMSDDLIKNNHNGLLTNSIFQIIEFLERNNSPDQIESLSIKALNTPEIIPWSKSIQLYDEMYNEYISTQ